MPQLPARRGRSTAAAQPVRAAFFGVGAPEAILVGVVALVVFGPKGLAQVGCCSTAARLARVQGWHENSSFSHGGARGGAAETPFLAPVVGGAGGGVGDGGVRWGDGA